MKRNRWILVALALAGVAAACGDDAGHGADSADTAAVEGESWTVRDTVVATTFEAAGVARPFAEATLSTRLMGQVEAVLVREGDRVAAGQPLVRIDAEDLAAKRAQVEASIREAEAVVRDAETQARRMRALHEQDAAPRVQLEAAETGLERARAGLSTARAAAAEVDAMGRYAVVRAPFDGIVTSRFVDPGDFAAPGAPMVTVLDAGRLRITATAAPDVVAGIARGDTLHARVEGVAAAAVVEGVVPGAGGSLYTVNAVVDNGAGGFLAGSAATLALPQGTRSAVLVPTRALIRRGDLAGVRVRPGAGESGGDAGGTAALRWLRLGEARDDMTEVLGGLEPGDVVVVPSAAGDRVARDAGAGEG